MASLTMKFDYIDSTRHSFPPIYRPLLYLMRSSSPQKANTTHPFSNEGVGFKSYTLNVYIGYMKTSIRAVDTRMKVRNRDHR